MIGYIILGVFFIFIGIFTFTVAIYGFEILPGKICMIVLTIFILFLAFCVFNIAYEGKQIKNKLQHNGYETIWINGQKTDMPIEEINIWLYTFHDTDNSLYLTTD